MSTPLEYRMRQVETWLGVVATRPLDEDDYKRAHTSPRSRKRFIDGFTYGASYMARHSRRSYSQNRKAKALAQALPVPLLGLAVVVIPLSTCFSQRREQKRIRSEEATREDTIAFELWNARQVAKLLARDDQLQMLKSVHGMGRRDIAAWASTCLSLTSKVISDVKHSNDRTKHSRLVERHLIKTGRALFALLEPSR